MNKRAIARQWLDKVKSSVLRGNAGVGIAASRPFRRNDNSSQLAGNTCKEKPTFEALKMIVSEGELLLRGDVTGGREQEDSKQIYMSSYEKLQSRTQQKELTRVMSIVEAAEEWQNKLKETVTNTDTGMYLSKNLL